MEYAGLKVSHFDDKSYHCGERNRGETQAERLRERVKNRDRVKEREKEKDREGGVVGL